MPAVQVRDFPDDVYELLKAEAKQCGRSINQHTKVILVEHFLNSGIGAEQISQQRQSLWDRIDAAGELAIDGDAPTPEQLVREMRDSR